MNERSAPIAPMPRLARYMVGRGWLHLSLLTCMGIFLLPFVWMVATSLKTDEELTQRGWFPSLPRFVARSPYVLPAPAPEKPIAIDQRAWERMLPALWGETRQAVEPFLTQRPDEVIDRAAQVESASAALINRLAARINIKLWDGPQAPMIDAYRAELTSNAIAEAVEQRLARFELLGLRLRTLDGNTFMIHDDKAAGDLWVIKSGPGKLLRKPGGGTYLQYDFGGADAEPIVLECPLVVSAPPQSWHNLSFSFKADKSWHRLDAELITPSEVWRSTRPVWIAQARAATALFQFPSFEDQTFKARTWTPLVPTGGREKTTDGNSLLRLTIRPSSASTAILGKVQANYARAFRSVPFWTYVGNSLILVVLTTLGTLFSSTFVAYAFARLRWPGKSVALIILLSTMMLPGQVTMIPSFVIWRQLGWYNTLNPLWVPAFLGGAFFIFLMTQHMKTIPRELEEAARIDGLGALQTWWYVIVPLVKPAAAAVAIMTVMGAWNEFMGPLIYLRDQGRFPLSLGLFAVRLDAGGDWTMIMAGNVLMSLPMIVMFIVFQRYFIHGMTMGGVKG